MYILYLSELLPKTPKSYPLTENFDVIYMP